MAEPTEIVQLDGRRLILGFDAGCMVCSELANRIEEQVGGNLEVLSLRDHRVAQWRKTALGGDAPWAPTLIEVKGLTVRAWTGWQMAVHLGRSLGPVATWRVMQTLGEVEAAPKIEHSSILEKLPNKAAEAVVGMSRRQFLKGAAGAALAVGVLSGLGVVPSRAEALESWQFPDSERTRVLKGAELRDYCNRVANRNDCAWVAGAGYAPSMQSGLSVTGADDEVAQGGGVKARAAEHFMSNGNSYYACSFLFEADKFASTKIVTFYRYEQPFRHVTSEIKRWGLGPQGNKFWCERATINGTRFTDPNALSLQSCANNCAAYQGETETVTCTQFQLTGLCVAALASCFICSFSCAGIETGIGVAPCVACVAVYCPTSIYNTCCVATCVCCFQCGPT